MTNWPLSKRNAGSRVVRSVKSSSVQCWTCVTRSMLKAPRAFAGAGAMVVSVIVILGEVEGWRWSDISAQIRGGAGGAGGMYAAFRFFGTRPAAGPNVAPLLHRAGAGPAADRGEAVGEQRVFGQVVLGGVGFQVGPRPVGERVELQ